MKTVFIPVLTFPINSYCIALRSTNPSSFSYDFRSRSFYDCNINLEGEAIKSVGNTLIICKVQLTLCGIRSTGVGVFLFAHLQMNEPNIKYSRCNNNNGVVLAPDVALQKVISSRRFYECLTQRRKSSIFGLNVNCLPKHWRVHFIHKNHNIFQPRKSRTALILNAKPKQLHFANLTRHSGIWCGWICVCERVLSKLYIAHDFVSSVDYMTSIHCEVTN